ncbi:unnamed protein product [Angiostrongylus costaricensis]|uniref:Reverse transcriptase domain-containing protein n=1 Tax=Angiostrongylus costaricensis TaxID=334426 RepID=A0A0R3PAP5_ANGCS|nr:unnamed protein product [Angiostrongylus costaricensis]
MKLFDWNEKGIRIGGKFLTNFRFADDIVTFSRSTSEAEVMINELNEAGKKIVLRINRKNTQFMKNSWCEGEKIELEGSPIAEATSYAYLGRPMNMENNMKKKLDRRRRAAWVEFSPLREATDQLDNTKIRPYLFDSTVFPVLFYAAETWVDTSTTSRMLQTTHRALELCLLKYNRHSQYVAACEALIFKICHIFEIQENIY